MEFVVTLPLLMGILVISYEYGEAYATREALDSAVRDATRYIARSPAAVTEEDRQDAEGNTLTFQRPEIQQFFIDNAIELISARTGHPENVIQFDPVIVSLDVSGGQLRSPFYEVVVTVRLTVELPTLGIFGHWIGSNTEREVGFVMEARDHARYLGEVPLGAQACSFVRNIHARAAGEPEC